MFVFLCIGGSGFFFRVQGFICLGSLGFRGYSGLGVDEGLSCFFRAWGLFSV